MEGKLKNFSEKLEAFGGPEGIRTLDLFHAMEARSQLRHRPIVFPLRHENTTPLVPGR